MPAKGRVCTEFSVQGKPLDLMAMLFDQLFTIDPNVKVSKSSWRLTFISVLGTKTQIIQEGEGIDGEEESKEEKEEKK